MRSQWHLAFDLSSPKNVPEGLAGATQGGGDAEGEGSCQPHGWKEHGQVTDPAGQPFLPLTQGLGGCQVSPLDRF